MNNKNKQYDQVLIEKNLVVEHKTDHEHFMEHPHYHDGFEIHYTLADGVLYQVEDRKFQANAGSIALFSPNEIHRVSVCQNKLYERYYLLFKPTFIQEFTSSFPYVLDSYLKHDKNNCLELTTENQKSVTQLFEELLTLNTMRTKDYHQLLLKMKLVELLLKINECIMDEDVLHKPMAYQNQPLITAMISYIKLNYSQNVTLDHLSQKFFISKSTILRFFKQSMGMTPNQFLISTRIIQSREFLKKGYTVKETALKVGYKDESSFIKKFRELQGDSPKQYTLKVVAERRNST